MKTTLISILLVIGGFAKAAPKQVSKPASRLSTNIKFDGHTVGGQVQSPFESLTEVENEKSIDQLIGARKNFNDRIQKANELR